MNENNAAKTTIDFVKNDSTFNREGFLVSEIKGHNNKLEFCFYDIDDANSVLEVTKLIEYFNDLSVPINITKTANMFLTFFQAGIVKGVNK